MSYVEGFVAAVPAANKEAYRKHAAEAAPLFKSFGATRMVEAWGDDVPEGKVTSFSMAVKREDNESIVFSWVVWPSKEARNTGMKKSMEDPRMNAWNPNNMPFDGKRMIFGGFEVLVQG